MANGDLMNVIDYGQFNTTSGTAWNGGICSSCGVRYVGTHWCAYWSVLPPTVTTYIPTIVSPDVTELVAEVKKLRKELKRQRKAES